MRAEPSAATRRAALLAHAMPEADREWLLASLPVPERATLQDLLRELAGLGIPADASLLEDLDKAPGLASLSGDGVQILASLLRAEPPAMTARLLRARDWPWKAAVVAQFDMPYARRVEEAGPLPAAPSLDDALVAEVTRQLGLAPREAPPSAARRTGLGRWWRRG